MPATPLQRTLDRASRKVPGLRRLPVLRLLALGEVALLARDHVSRLTPEERHRLVELVRIGHGRRQNLTLRERDELHELVVKVAPREFAAHAAQKLSPLPLPEPVVERVAHPRRSRLRRPGR